MAAPLYWLGRRCIRFRWAVLGRLDRALPHISIEGDEYFAQRDRELERVG
jgi:hypothetical protein